MADDGPSRRMKFPYTYSAKIVQFPWKFYFQHAWVFKYSVFAYLVTVPIFLKFQSMSNSPENVKKWEEIHRKEFYGEGH